MGNFEQTLITMGYQLPPDGLWGDIITLPEMPLLIIAWIMTASVPFPPNKPIPRLTNSL
jgi:hypothetical protein